MGTLEKLLGPARIKLVRLFFLNPESVFAPKDIVRRAQLNPTQVRKEIALLMEVDFIKKASVQMVVSSSTKGKKLQKKRINGFALNPLFSLLEELRNLALSAAPISKQALVERLRRVGRVKLVVLAGIFIKDPSSRIDMLVVGDVFNKSGVERIMKSMEADIGKELAYALMDTKEFKYRFGMYDKFVRDIMDYPHEVLLDKLGLTR
ncbi:MAG: hypothetical protein A3C84_04735 [Candidatus Ryanbacteria bacterium RIFCSPHIGHO2_02_FULL_48_12]|uniref:Transcriptional regulator n=1 Tax=Candidatus Ryanbacteria bacterium RIFCSPHIGHO2_01_FULL_48_27 TaxID=1802115 RepID=A0A1G2G2U3_9BACT|nr:MAG: hypothetical protein A2756_04365 [Candidatus Ryanbacteria bacterium RIFCSPHIGHO2_01_FULL_48_27]OGZ48740.1 MAG: hypothetical protein A3C84_04735 [Candidatus Ryanbacteria bacterium RIFCSPHIGHO2_02_FULL_48_12]